jgi:folate-binding protein YgfZ
LSAAPSASAQAVAVRAGVGVFRLADRGLIEVRGGDRVRWLDGMLSNDVARLSAGRDRSGCYALALDAKGRIVADVHVLLRDGAFWLDTARAAVPRLLAHFGRHLIADDVELRDIGASADRLGVEGPLAQRLLAHAAPGAAELAADCCAELRTGAGAGVVARYGWSGEDAFALFVRAGAADLVIEELLGAAVDCEPVLAAEDALEILRIEAGTPRFGAEIDESVLPAEARLERAVARSKGCYVGQEVVARMQAARRVSHQLIGLALGEAPPAEPGSAISAAEGRVGEVTSSCRSALAGSIALGFVRSAHAQPGAELRVADVSARVAALPFVAPRAPAA